jgi:hypothetical protein
MSYIWTTAEGNKIPVSCMKDSHLRNAFYFSLRKLWAWSFRVYVLSVELLRRKITGDKVAY